jgi:NOL1/NOP2/fmu family ribosome biogenesis protein
MGHIIKYRKNMTHQLNTIGNLKILNSKETKHILQKLSEQYGYNYDKTEQEYVFLMNKDNRIYIISRGIELLPYDEMRIDSIGMYFGELYKESLRLSIEGSQFIGPKSTKNIVDIDKNQMVGWIKGNDIEHEDTGKDFIILRHTDSKSGKSDYFGAGKYKDGKIMNYVSKSRRLIVVNN